MQKPLSRLEKFIYALCSLDSSELPNPLSRLEVLLNCLVTGETPPAFEPLSRNEKYLMAISGSYHDELPNPISRGEKLLYKLATGDDSIDDIGEALSRYEELLAYIVENGCLDGPIDVEYVTYILMSGQNTLYNTAKKPVKSAILKGQTKILDELGNEFQSVNSPKAIMGAWIGTATGEETSSDTSFHTAFLKCPTVTFFVGGDNKYKRIIFYDENKTFISGVALGKGDNTHVKIGLVDIPTNAVYMRISASINPDGVSYTPSTDLLITDEDGNNIYITHLESVKMPVLTTTGKNLVKGIYESYSDIITFNIEPLKNGGTYTYSPINFPLSPAGGRVSLLSLATGSEYVIQDWNNNVYTFTMPNDNIIYDKIKFWKAGLKYNDDTTLQLEEGSVKTEYEPYKSTTVTCNEEVELRGIGDVKDELNLLTGELTERIKTTTLDNFTLWNKHPNVSEGFSHFTGYVDDISATPYVLLCDSLPVVKNMDVYNGTSEGLYYNGNKYLHITIKTDKLSTNDTVGLTRYLKNNIITIQYPLKTESIKTVDISMIDQDGNNTKLKTFEDITHVTVTSEGILPDVELEVATKNEELLNTMSLKMDDIYATQTTLEETSNAQSENVDATMMATTEIYEGLL